MRILACDSGLERTGYALFDTEHPDTSLLEYDCIFTKKGTRLQDRLMNLNESLEELVVRFKPEMIVIEKLFFQNNQTTAIMVAQAQGVLLLLAGKHNIEVEFMTPTEVKHVVTGYGRSDKKSVQKMLSLLLGLSSDELKQDDTADAIACGFAYCTINKLI